MTLCKTCGLREPMLGHSECLRCWVKPGTPAQDDPEEYDFCAHCGRPFLARTSADDFYCDDCYRYQEYLDEDQS